MSRSFEETVAHYRALQHIACWRAQDAIIRTGAVAPPVVLRRYDAMAETAWHSEWQGRRHPTGSGGWNWPEIVRTRWKRPAAFRVAIWSGSTLCGLAIGHPSKTSPAGGRRTLSVNLIESSPLVHPLQGVIAMLATTYATEYGRLLGSSRVRLMNPLPGVLDTYAALGFSIILQRGRPLYCAREI
jgi:hypothetical protein